MTACLKLFGAAEFSLDHQPKAAVEVLRAAIERCRTAESAWKTSFPKGVRHG